ncbi:hypothetical protein GCM10010387_37040 [Streptomyces inusitatus]|uniref:Uncharacterized protein n=1 Tax=Streptomyces inusitatus TaxID=68221 RepID=A0A918QA03_9ACTN|nr:hypothetical protein GCM10010387_37040 [Streptomyces inusitatus]
MADIRTIFTVFGPGFGSAITRRFPAAGSRVGVSAGNRTAARGRPGPPWVAPAGRARVPPLSTAVPVCSPSDEGRPPDGGPALAETFLTESTDT